MLHGFGRLSKDSPSLLLPSMGNCCNSKPTKPPLHDSRTHTDVLTEGKSPSPPSALTPKPPNLDLRTHVIETLETQENCGSYADSSAPSLFQTLDQPLIAKTSSGDAEESGTQRVAKVANCMHRLGRAFRLHERYNDSIKMLRLAHELYASAGLGNEADTCVGDLLLIQLTTGCFEPLDLEPSNPLTDRIALLTATIAVLSGRNDRQFTKTLKRFKVKAQDLSTIVEKAEGLDKLDLQATSLADSLTEAGHYFRLFLNCPEQALLFYDEAIRYSPGDCRVYFYLALASKALENYSEAVRYYRQALVIDPTFADCHYNLGNLYCEDLNHLQGAEHSYLNALNSLAAAHAKPQEPKPKVTTGQVLHMLSRVYSKSQQLDLAYHAALRSLLEKEVQDEYFITAINLSIMVAPMAVKALTQQRSKFMDGEFDGKSRDAIKAFMSLCDIE